ncbi:MAG: GNAT family N-acetyltransferase [Bacteroidales bacterium]|nr:GNAT family N-acetyltransferase [Bacteroidales bacterium]MDE5956225.1 GNAT family N-acetyltransferase [Bacteroidales bacterium]
MEKIIIRPASKEDAPFIAVCVTAAMGVEPGTEEEAALLAVMKELCAMEESLYSYRHADIAADPDTLRPAGCLISYDGGLYKDLREKTFAYAAERLGKSIGSTDMETGPGEFYLDSLSVSPEFRGAKTGRKLILNAIRKGQEAGFREISLIVDKEKPGLQAYYAATGFVPKGEITFFGHPYIRMVHSILAPASDSNVIDTH